MSSSQQRPDITVVLESYGFHDLPSSYNWRAIKCEFHGDRNASAQINTDEGFYRCFTCDFWGDGYEVIKWREGVKFPEAKRIYEGLTGTDNSTVRGAAGPGSGVPGKAWHQRGSGEGGKAGRGRYTGTYSR